MPGDAGETRTHRAWLDWAESCLGQLAGLQQALSTMRAQITADDGDQAQACAVSTWQAAIGDVIAAGRRMVDDVADRQLPAGEAVAAAGGPAATPPRQYADETRGGGSAAVRAGRTAMPVTVMIWPDSQDRAEDPGQAAVTLAHGGELLLAPAGRDPGAGPALRLRRVAGQPGAEPGTAMWQPLMLSPAPNPPRRRGEPMPPLPDPAKLAYAADFAAMRAAAEDVAARAGLRVITGLDTCPAPHWLHPGQVCGTCQGSGYAAWCTVCSLAADCDGIHDYCLECDGGGTVSCQACEGDGRVYDSDGEGTPCGECASGQVTCPDCGGSGRPGPGARSSRPPDAGPAG
jgi:hypothetical protein